MPGSAGPFNRRSPAELHDLINDVRQFRRAYIHHLNATLPSVMAGNHVGHSAERTRVLQLAVRAERAVAATGLFVAISPPPVAIGQAPKVGLAAVAFSHEGPTFRLSADRMVFTEDHKQGYDYAIDAVDIADEVLCQMLRDELKRRRRPSYWIDRTLRAILGFPAYLLSLIFGFDRHELSPRNARALWLVSLAADVAGIYGLGLALGWW